ncbi:MAG: transglycosylase SLT domain-containing protein [Anaerolineae bacterium]|nr:transglycosylase SLT domain-containing protein [Anaerolineae bacterium]
MVRLVDGGQPVDERLRGLIDYYAKAYGPAVQAFYRIIQGDPDHDGEPHYYAGLSFLKAGSLEQAVDEFEMLIETHPDDAYVPDASMAKAQALLALERPDAAVEAYRAGLEWYTAGPQTPAAVWDTVERFAATGSLTQTGELMLDLAERYPDDARAPEARFRAGLSFHRAGDALAARAAWQDLTRWYPYAEQTQGAWYWLGKTYLSAGETISATEALSSAIALGAWSFYGLQAGDLLEGRKAFIAYPDALAACEGATAQAEAESWLASRLGLDAATSIGSLSATLANDVRLRLGTRLLQLGHFDEGRTELEALRTATSEDPLAQYQLALYFRDVGLYRSSIIAAAAVWRLSGAEDVTEIPPFIGCLAYPRYYRDLVEQEAAAYGLSPLFAYALLRQESLFEGFATSFAAAHGLMQVIPPTGAAIAQALDWPPAYTTQDLYRPMVSVRFGIWYLVEQRDLFDGNLYPAMAAYNGGPGNALRWMAAAEDDTDLFAELIGFSETRRYVRLIREHYARYRYLYSAPIELMTPAVILRGSE